VFYWLLKLVVLGPVLKLVFRPKVEGLEYVPRSGPVILACNHLSFSDSIFTPLIMRRKVTFVAKAEYFTGKGVKGWFSRMFFTGAGTIPVDRSGGEAAQAALDTLLRVLEEGNIAGIYPEGTRSPDGRLYRGRTGAARLAVAAGVPIIPVGVLGTERVQPIGQPYPMPFRGKVTIKFGAPIDTTGRADDRTSLRELTDELMSEIQKLTGQEYVSRYAPAKPPKG
jgi:1-acyl-sn-glycerol-3-phosphate acyltransferase